MTQEPSMPARRLNAVIERLEGCDVVVSSRPVANGSIDQAQAFGDSDFDMVIFEMEHYGFDFAGLRLSLQALLNRKRIAEDGLRNPVVPLARIPTTGREATQWLIKQALDIGVYGLVVPQLETPEEAVAVVTAMRYPARRGSLLGGGRSGFGPDVAARYWGLDRATYVEKADVWPVNPDGEILLIGMIESRKGLENLERILDATHGISAIWPGSGDLAADMGLIGELTHPDVEDMVQQARSVCASRGVPCASGAHGLPEAVQRVQQGFGIIMAPLERGLAATVRHERRCRMLESDSGPASE